MQLKPVDKAIYRSHLNRIIIVFVVTFAALALGFGTILISLFGETPVDGEQVNNFRFNLLGVILGLIVVGALLNKAKDHAYFEEVYYVWQLKQIHNLIYRKLKKIKSAATENNVDALIILHFYYTSLKQVYELDDNTLTISNVNTELDKVVEQAQAHQLTISTEQFSRDLLKSF